MAVKKNAKKNATKKNAPKGKSSKRSKTSKKAKAVPAKARAKPGTPSLSSIAASLTANDVEKSLAWYRDVVGFAVGERWETDGKLSGVMLSAGSVSFMIGQDDWKKGRDRKKGEGFRLYCETKQDVDALAKAIVGRGGTLDQGPTDQPWGNRDFSLTDPDGFKITIAGPAKK